jgi:tetratricopeptide (TPR) repeat protein
MCDREYPSRGPAPLRTSHKSVLVAVWLLAIVFFIFGLHLALHNGIGWDEKRQDQILAVNLSAIKGLLRGSTEGYRTLSSWAGNVDNFYGTSFELFSYPFQAAIAPWYARTFHVDMDTAFMLAKHVVLYACFVGSTFVFYQLIETLIENRPISLLFTTVYFLYPYLLGHNTHNPKDAPFMVLWLTCTLLLQRCLSNPFFPHNTRQLVGLGVATGGLISVRVAGVLIFLQYAIAVAFAAADIQLPRLYTRSVLKAGAVFLVVSAGTLYVLYPVIWANPLRIREAITAFSKFPHFGCTVTMGTCMPAQALPFHYIPDWLIVKLPLLALVGIIFLPFTFRRIGKSRPGWLLAATLLGTVITVPVVLITTRVALLNEIRHLLFLVPLFLLLGFASVYYLSRRLTVFFLASTLTIFVADNVMIYPYQYIWYNEIARFSDINKYFLSDYWGTRGRETSTLIAKNYPSLKEQGCVFAAPLITHTPFLKAAGLPCFGEWEDLYSYPETLPPVILADVNIDRSAADHCKETYRTNRYLLFATQPIRIATIFLCGPAPGVPTKTIPAAVTDSITARSSAVDEAVAAYGRADYAAALRLLRPLAEAGDAAAQLSLGFLFDLGRGVPQDHEKAMKLYRLAAEQGHANAQFNVGLMYRMRDGVQGEEEGARWYGLDSHGKAVRPFSGEAEHWYRKAADQGYAPAQFNLGYMYDNGEGVTEDFKEALKWYRLAAEQSDPRAKLNVPYLKKQRHGIAQEYLARRADQLEMH